MLEGQVFGKVIEKEMEPAQRHRLAFTLLEGISPSPCQRLEEVVMVNTYFSRII
jgi:hypothetical protein